MTDYEKNSQPQSPIKGKQKYVAYIGLEDCRANALTPEPRSCTHSEPLLAWLQHLHTLAILWLKKPSYTTLTFSALFNHHSPH